MAGLRNNNRGSEAVSVPFWVDVYFDPSETPGLNQPWGTIVGQAATWGVIQSLPPGDTLTLTSGGVTFDASHSSPPFAAGATVYAYVGSVDFSTSHGAVQESREDNNLAGPETISVGGSAAVSEWNGGPVEWDRLPGR